jgi:hypothetical protein
MNTWGRVATVKLKAKKPTQQVAAHLSKLTRAAALLLLLRAAELETEPVLLVAAAAAACLRPPVQASSRTASARAGFVCAGSRQAAGRQQP